MMPAIPRIALVGDAAITMRRIVVRGDSDRDRS
jgi:hypothetical protein